ncbi:hypothetical protein [Nonomuraea typhae]|uniref:hypothetical protein n=1 Tax=Nonomuraea typhae TaxID=2603600 RepID=UPI0015E1F2C7|nr:hypothetical protein [Nonomuraea typhae]
MAKLGNYRDFLRMFVKLEKQVQDRVAEVFTKFEGATYASLHLEPVKNAKDQQMRTMRINDFWRGVVLAPAKGDTYVLLNVLPHDKVYEWAKRHRATVNTVTATIELRDVVTLETTSTPASSAGSGGGCLWVPKIPPPSLTCSYSSGDRSHSSEHSAEFERVLSFYTRTSRHTSSAMSAEYTAQDHSEHQGFQSDIAVSARGDGKTPWRRPDRTERQGRAIARWLLARTRHRPARGGTPRYPADDKRVNSGTNRHHATLADIDQGNS